jgi:predicted alpha/beta hydrolase
MTSATTAPLPEPEAVDIVCADGERLRGHFLPAAGATRGAPVLLCPATGVKQHFYLRFAAWLASQGHAILACRCTGA